MAPRLVARVVRQGEDLYSVFEEAIDTVRSVGYLDGEGPSGASAGGHIPTTAAQQSNRLINSLLFACVI